MHITLLYQQLSQTPTLDEQDVLVQCDAVEAAIRRQGHQVSRLSLSLDLSDVLRQLDRLRPDVVFNLVESVGGTDRLMPLATMILESRGLRFTGAGSLAMIQTSGKISAKRLFESAAIPTPAWLEAGDQGWHGKVPAQAIIKTIWEHSSFGIDDASVVDCGPTRTEHLRCELKRRFDESGREWFAEQFIPGREFNLSALASSGGPVVLPPAEIQFVNFAAGQHRIVGYAAKWQEQSREYEGTPRTFAFPDHDASLIQQLKELTLRCWQTFGLRGYARVDFRVDEQGMPWVLEVNVNPCLSPDAGFAAAVAQHGMTFDDAVWQILEDAHV